MVTMYVTVISAQPKAKDRQTLEEEYKDFIVEKFDKPRSS